MEDTSRFETLIEKFANIKEKYSDEYPIILYDPNIESKEKKSFKDLISRNNSVHLFSESGSAFKFAQSLGISFIFIVPSDYDEEKLIQEFQRLREMYQRRMLDFEEEGLLKDLFKGISNQMVKSLKAYVFCMLLDCLTESATKEDEEEVMTMCDIKDIAKEFRQEFILLWYDPDISPESKQKLEEEIDIKIEEKNIYIELADLYKRIKSYGGTPYHLIMSRSEKAKKIVKEIDQYHDLLGLYIYCKNFEKNKKIENEKVEIRRTIEELIPQIKEGVRTRSKLKNSFPVFATNFDISDRTGIYKLHYYLKGLRNFKNRKQAQEDFVQLALKIYQDDEKQLVLFQRQYDEYNKEDILRWYTKESPIYKLINNCLRISSLDSILYCRLILKDLERAIREQYKQKTKDFNGLVFRGAYISPEEWKKLQSNIGEEIEMYGFLSTTVNAKTAMNFLKADPKNKIFIKIIIPPLPEEDEQGFADISKFSEFQNEQEILFNVRSRFRILEAGILKIDNRGTEYRQLVLLFGAQQLRKYITKNKPAIEINLELPPEINCDLCGSVNKLFGFKQQEETFVNCLECLIKGSMPKDTPLIALNGEKDRVQRILQGIILKSKEGVIFSNSGYKCHDCKTKGKDKYYKWMSFDGKNISIQCSNCLENKKIIKNQILVSETCPYAMWQEPQREWEITHSDYQGILSQRVGSDHPGHVYLETENIQECLNYGKKKLCKIANRRRRELSKLDAFGTLAEAFGKLGEYQQALKCWTNCQSLLKLLGQEVSSSEVIICFKIGLIHFHLSRYKEALGHYNRALDFQKSISPELHPLTALLYNGIASVYASLSEHQKALDAFTNAVRIQKSVFGEKHPATASGYNSLALFYQQSGKNQDALKYFTLALEINESIYGEKHSSTATSYGNLASVYPELGQHQKAIELFHKAIAIQKSIYQAEHPSIAKSYDNLAKAYQFLGKHQEAREYFKKALDINKSFYGEIHSRTSSTLNNLGMACQGLCDYRKALEYYLKALDYKKSLFGEKHLDVTILYNHIGSVYRTLGEHKKALEYFEKALNLQKLLFKGPHQCKAISYNNVALIYEDFGQYQKALEYHENAINMDISLHGENHSETSASYNNIGTLYNKLGEHSKAIEYFHKAVEIQKLIFGEENSKVALSYNNLGLGYRNMGDYPHALEYLTKALGIQKSIHEGDHPDIATVYNNLGTTFIKLGEFKKAKEYLKKALRIRKSIFTENHPDVGTVYNSLGLLNQHLRKCQKALKYYLKATAIFESMSGEIHPSTAASYENIGSIYNALGNYQEALKYHTKSLKIRQEIFGEKHLAVASSYNNLGLCYSASGENQKARDSFLKGIEILKSLGGEQLSEIWKLYHNLIFVYSKLGDHKKAQECFSKAVGFKK